MKQQLVQKFKDEKEHEFSTNEVLKEEKSTRTLYYIPCYVRFKVKELLNLDIEGLQGSVSGTLLFSFYYGNLDRSIIDQFVGEADKAILLQFSRQDSVLLKQDKGITYKQDLKSKMIDFVVRQDFTCNLVGDVFYTPFEVINLYLTITIQTIPLDPKNNNGRRVDIKFNCMKCSDVMLISHGEKVNLGNYNLANHFLDAKFTNSDKNPYKSISVWQSQQIPIAKPKQIGTEKSSKSLNQTNQLINLQEVENDRKNSEINSPVKLNKQDAEDKKIKHFQYVHFRIPLYQYPGANLVQIFIPLWVLGFINILIFFQETSLAGRVAVISTLTLAFIAFIPTINEKIPQTPYIKLVEILIYMETIATVLCLIDSLIIWTNQDQSNPTYVFDWRTDGWFITTIIINIVSVFIVILLFIVHKVYWERVYTSPRDLNRKEGVLLKQKWGNLQSDEYFEPFIKKGRIKVI